MTNLGACKQVCEPHRVCLLSIIIVTVLGRLEKVVCCDEFRFCFWLLPWQRTRQGIGLDTWYRRKKSSRLDFCYLKFPSRGPHSNLFSSGRAAGGSAKSCICCILCYRYRSKRVNVQGALSCRSLNCLQTARNSTYFVGAAVVCSRSEKKKYGMHPEFLQHLAAVVGGQR